jgi:hypothetical protein
MDKSFWTSNVVTSWIWRSRTRTFISSTRKIFTVMLKW